MNKKVISWPAEAIWEQIAPILSNFTVEVLPEIDSTNSELMRRTKAGQIEPILLVAEKQTAGRGRLGRAWHDLSKRTDNIPTLTFSLGMPLSPVDWSGLSLAVGTSIAQSLHPQIGLKWPNDLWINEDASGDTPSNGDRKLAGILIETCAIQDNHMGNARYVIVGVGVNIVRPEQNPPLLSSLRTPAAWLQELLPQSQAQEALQLIALSLVQTILTFSNHGFAPFQDRFNLLDVLKNRQINVDNNIQQINSDLPPTKMTGVAQGVNQKGELILHTDRGIHTLNSSEVSIKLR